MSRRRHKPNHAALAERANRFKAIQAELMQELPDTPSNRQRAETVALIDMASDHVRQAILHGQPVEIGALERLAAARASILPVMNTSLNVHFIDGSDVCIRCRAPLPPKEERSPSPEAVPEAAQAALAVPTPEREQSLSPATPAAAAAQVAPAPSTPPAPPAQNVVALHGGDTGQPYWLRFVDGGRGPYSRFDNNG